MILAVRPDRQRLAIGTALMNARHAILDRDRTPSYLEASDPAKRAIYRAHGYADLRQPIQPPRRPRDVPQVAGSGGKDVTRRCSSGLRRVNGDLCLLCELPGEAVVPGSGHRPLLPRARP